MDEVVNKKTEIDVREVVRVAFSGLASYVAVHFLLLPRLAAIGLGFPAYFYIGVGTTVVLAVAIGLILRPREEACEDQTGVSDDVTAEMFPAE